MKRKIWLILSIIFAMVSVLGMAVACGEDPVEDPPQLSAEQGEYYYSAGSEDYSLELILGNTFTLKIKGENLSGKYVLDGELLTFTVDGGNELSATYRSDVVTLTYGNDTYRFLRKINYTVTFQTNGGSAVADATVVNGKTVEKPEDPEKGELVFVGWYTENTFRNLFSFTQPITANLTLYARFVETINPEFTVSFDVNHEGGEEIPAQETVGHKLFNLPTPEWAGHTFVGWWMSQYGTADKLTAEYTEQTIDEPITLYAKWDDGAPAVSVSEQGISWRGRSGNVSYTVTIIGPNEETVVDNVAVSVAEYDFDFTKQEEGDYIVEVTMSGKKGTAYYRNRGLARVTDFKVTESTLFFNPVPNATNYLLTVECGSADHTHVDLDLGTKTSWDFSECDMKADGITFTVKATAENYLTSVSEPYKFTRTLNLVTGLKVDAATDVATWEAVERATSYLVSVTVNGEPVYTGKVDDMSGIDLQYYDAGEVVVTVVPAAFGWISPAATEYKYTKTHLATPANPRLNESTVEWDPVTGANGYQVTFDGKTYQVTTNAFELKEEYYDATQSSYDFTVCALGKTAAENSLWMPVFTIRNGEMSDVSYNAGSVVWDAVFGIKTFLVKINDGEAVEVTGTSFAVTLPKKGENTISVCAVSADGTQSEWKTIEVFAYEIAFDAQGGAAQDGGDIAPIYIVKGDPIKLPKAERYGYTFNNWFTEPNGQGQPFDRTTFQDEYDRTIYAAWTANGYKIFFDAGDFGDGPYDENGELIKSVDVTFGSEFKLPVPNSTDILRAFGGWVGGTDKMRYTDYNGISTGAYLYAGDVTLTASWEMVLSFKQNDNGEWSVSKGKGINYVKEVTVPVMYNNKLVSVVQDFTDCATIETINIPDTVKLIALGQDGATFKGCNALKNINIYNNSVFPTDVVYYSVDGVLFYYNAAADGGRMEIKYYPYAREAVEYTIPGVIQHGPNEEDVYYVSAIPSGAFSAPKSPRPLLTKINIPATVSLIESLAFNFYYDLCEINFLPVQEGEVEASSLNIRTDAFGDPKESSALARIKSITLPKRLSENPREAFADLTYLAYIDVEEGGKFSSVDGLLTQTSERVNGLELVYYPRNRHVGDDGKAYIPETTSTTNRAREFVVPEGIYAIGEKAVLDNNVLYKIVIPGYVRYIGVSAFQGLRVIKEIIFTGEKEDLDLEIAEKAFLGENWTNTTSPTIPNYTTSLKTLVLPANLTKLGRYAFGALSGATNNDNNQALREVHVNVDRPKVEFAAGAFNGSMAGNVHSASYIKTLYFGAGVPEFEILDVFGSNVKEVYVAEGNPYYWSDPDTGVLYDASKEKLILFPASWEGPYTIPEGITNIQSGMFKERTGLTEIVIHKGVTRVGFEAFYGCTALTTVTFEEGGEEALIIDDNAFYKCSALVAANLPARTISIGVWAFRECSSLTTFTIPRDVEYLGTSTHQKNEMQVFWLSKSLKELKVAEGNTHYAVQDNVLYKLREVKLTPDASTTTLVPDQAIYVPAAVEGEIKVSGYIRSLGAASLSRSSSSDPRPQITKITFEDIIDTYDPVTGELQSSEVNFNPHEGQAMWSPICYLETLVELHLPVGMTVIPSNFIYGCPKLEKVNVPNTVTSIEKSAFGWNSVKLTAITFDEGGTAGLRIEDGETKSSSTGSPSYIGAFGQTKIKTIEFPARLTYVGKYAFAHNPGGTSGAGWSSTVENVIFAKEATFGLTVGENAFYYAKQLKSVELPKGITNLANSAFSYCGLSSITLPEGLKTIGNNAFQGCSSLTSITFPEGLTSIGNNAFSGTKLETLTLPEGLETIGNSAFSGLSRLTGELRIPASVTSIGQTAFNGTRVTKVITLADNKLATIGNSVFASNPDLTEVEFGKTDTPLTFGTSVFTGCTGLTSFMFPANVVGIGASMLANLTTLKAITFAPEISQLETVGALAFSKTGITSISFPESSAEGGISLGANLFKSCTTFTMMNLSASISSIDGVLNGCASIKTITIDSANKYLEADETLPIIYKKGANGERGMIALVYGELSGSQKDFTIAPGTTEIGGGAFANQSELEIVRIASSVRTIGDYAFQNCVNLKQIIIPNDSVLESIGSGAFMNCWSLESINLEAAAHLREFGDGKYGYSPSADDNGVFMYAGIHSEKELKIKLPASVEKVGKYMFTNSGAVEIDMSAATKLKELPTGAGTTTYGGRFVGLFTSTKLTSVKLPSSLIFLGTYTFGGCTALTEVDLSELTNLEVVGNSSATNKPTASTSSSYYLFGNCKSLQKVIFPTSVKIVGPRMFSKCENLTEIKGFDNVEVYAQYIYEGTGITQLTITGGTMSKNMFANMPKLTKVKFEGIANLTAANLFDGCTALTTIEFFNCNITNFTASSLFENCTALTSVDLSGTNVSVLPSSMFEGCSKLTQVTLPASLTATGRNTFKNCTALTKINLSECTQLTRIGTEKATDKVTYSTSGSTFYGCSSLTQITLPESCTMLASSIFEGCTSLNQINLDKVTVIGAKCFKNTGFTEITVPSSLNVRCGDEIFTMCEKLTKVTVPATIGTSSLNAGKMFKACPNLQTVVINAFSGMSLPSSMFEACTALHTVDMKNFTGTLGSSMFKDCTKLTTVTMPDQFKGCSSSVFQNTGITSIDLSGYTGKMLGKSMFKDCANLSGVTLPSQLNCLGTYTFQNCTSLTSIDISETQVNRFSESATGNIYIATSVYTFDGCVNLQEVITRPGQIVQIGSYTFGDCEKLTSFDISAVTRLGSNAFRNAGISGKVTLPASLTDYYVSSSNHYAFTDCTGITEFEVAEGCQAGLTTVEGALVEASSGMIIHLPGGATIEGGVLDLNDEKFAQAKFGVYMFSGISNVKKVILPKDMTELPAYLFYNSGVEEVVLPAGLTTIGNCAFQNSGIKKIELPAGLTMIGNSAFQNSSIEEVVLPAGLTTIGDYAFRNSGLKKITIPATVTSIGKGAFAETYQLEQVTFLEPAAGEEAVPLTLAAGATTAAATTVGVFRDSAIKNITLPGRMVKLADGAFHYSAVETVTLSEGTTEIGSAAFAYATSLKTVNMPASVTKLGNYVYAYTKIDNLMLGEGVTTLGNYVYTHVETLGDLKPADFKNVETIGERTFEYTTNIKQIEFSNKITSFGNYLLQYSNIETVKIPGSVVNIGSYMLERCEKVDSVVVEDLIDEEATRGTMSGTFRNSSIKSVVLGKGVESLSGTFVNCPNLVSVKVPEGVTTVTNQAFMGCTNLTSLELPESLTTIGTQAFANCKGLKSLVIYDNIESIAFGSANDTDGTGPFAGWTSEQTIYFTASRSYISALVGMDWINNAANMLKANIVYDYKPVA